MKKYYIIPLTGETFDTEEQARKKTASLGSFADYVYIIQVDDKTAIECTVDRCLGEAYINLVTDKKITPDAVNTVKLGLASILPSCVGVDVKKASALFCNNAEALNILLSNIGKLPILNTESLVSKVLDLALGDC